MGWFNVESIHTLDEISLDQWDLLCDGCGICCLYKVNDEHTSSTYLTRVACRYLDMEQCTCRLYAQRQTYMPTCVKITRKNVLELDWLPETCAYRRIAENKPLPWWHPLRGGRRGLVHELGISVRHMAMAEKHADMNNLARYITENW